MSKKQYIKRHHLIINKLQSQKCDFKTLQKYLEYNSIDDDYAISKRTFERDVNEIRSIYGINIQYNRSGNYYEIIQDTDEGKTERILENIQIFNALSLSDTISDKIIIEKRQPLGVENMFTLLQAIKSNNVVTFTYHKYWNSSNEISQRTVQPLALKEAQNRWYLVATETKGGEYKTFGLDRMSDLQISKIQFEYPAMFDIDEKFKNSFGIITDETKPQKIKLQFTPNRARYIKTMPLHHSQQILSDNDTECVVTVYLSPTYDFAMELLAMGPEVKVLQPKSLQTRIKALLLKSIEQYS